MPGVRKLVLCAASITALCLTESAFAQQPQPQPVLPDNGKISFQSGILPRKPKAGLPNVPAPPQAWPRLETGAIVCRNEDDLDRLAARNTGEPSSGPVDCQTIRSTTAITIVARHGPGKTEIRLTSGQGTQVGTTGWTSTFLPERPPAGVTAAAVR